MAEEVLIDNLTRGHQFDGGPFALDLYRLLAMALSDRRMSGLGDETRYHQPPVWQLQDRFRKGEIIRILVSSATALRILLDQNPRLFKKTRVQQCGSLWSRWPKNKGKVELLTLREACNKLIHATDIRDDLIIPDRRNNPDEVGTYIRPFVYLYGTKDGTLWRAKLSLVHFAQHATSIFLHWMP